MINKIFKRRGLYEFVHPTTFSLLTAGKNKISGFTRVRLNLLLENDASLLLEHLLATLDAALSYW